jgi:hypothetical protein
LDLRVHARKQLPRNLKFCEQWDALVEWEEIILKGLLRACHAEFCRQGETCNVSKRLCNPSQIGMKKSSQYTIY